MSDKVFKLALWALALVFTAVLIKVVGPPLAADGWNVVWAFGQGFVNPYSSGYAYDIFFSYAVLAVWVIHEAMAKGVKHGWIALVLGVIPGVAVGLAAYLLIRARQPQTA
jgi:hypothetical protein